MSAAPGTARKEQRRVAMADLRRKLHRAAVAMSMMPAAELARHLGLPNAGTASKLLQDQRLTQKLYTQLVDDEHVPDIATIPDHSELRVMDSVQDFENACECIDVMLALNERGIMIPRDDVKELARRYGDTRLKWAWDNREIWVDKSRPSQASPEKGGTGDTQPQQQDSAPALNPATLQKSRRHDPRRLLLDHLAREIPEISTWLGKMPVDPSRRPAMSPQMQITADVVARLVDEAGASGHGHG